LSTECALQPLLGQALEATLSDEAFAQVKADLERNLAQTEHRTMACGARVDQGIRRMLVELTPSDLEALLTREPGPLLVDIRERYEQQVDRLPAFASDAQSVPASAVVNAIDAWLHLPEELPIVLYCRSGNRSMQVARALRLLGRSNVWSVAGGLALHQRPAAATLSRPCVA
jgi:rhodanese-related sulfurtransferase